MMDFIRSATEELSALPFFSRTSSVEETFGASGTFSVDLDFTKATKQLETFLAAAKKQMRLSADGSAIVSAASAALAQVRSMLAGANLTLKVKAVTEGEPSGSFPGLPEKPGTVRLAVGGRFSSPTHAEIAEDGDPEYVVPVRKENEAVPLIRSMLSELSASARASLRDALPPAEPSPAPGFSDILSTLPDLFSAVPAAAAPVAVPAAPSHTVQAPVNIHVEASAADPEAVGRSIYDTAERYLLRTIQGVF